MFLLIEAGRIWMLASLGERWTTRIIVLTDAPLVSRGPYRWVNHPNYLVVVAEILVLPLVFGLWRTALVFSLLNAVLLVVRIRAENRALGR
ncbi:MAG: isoprenylcysteine carboxylmethyltransferase family protein [Sphingomicrobium sp.]